MALNMSILICAIAKKHSKTLTKHGDLISCSVTSYTSLEVVCL